MFWDIPYPPNSLSISKGAAQKCLSSGVKAFPMGLAAINAPTVPPAFNVRDDVPNPPLVTPHRAPNPAPALPISNLVSADKNALRPNSV